MAVIKEQKTTSICKDAEKLVFVPYWWEWKNGTATMENNMECPIFHKVKSKLPCL